jgi:hypothetical protein
MKSTVPKALVSTHTVLFLLQKHIKFDKLLLKRSIPFCKNMVEVLSYSQ